MQIVEVHCVFLFLKKHFDDNYQNRNGKRFTATFKFV
jgi:hypothetical protein